MASTGIHLLGQEHYDLGQFHDSSSLGGRPALYPPMLPLHLQKMQQRRTPLYNGAQCKPEYIPTCVKSPSSLQKLRSFYQHWLLNIDLKKIHCVGQGLVQDVSLHGFFWEGRSANRFFMIIAAAAFLCIVLKSDSRMEEWLWWEGPHILKYACHITLEEIC